MVIRKRTLVPYLNRKKERRMNIVLCKGAGERICSLRKEKGYSREKFAVKAGISSKFLYEIERGEKRFSAETLGYIAKTLEVSCDYLLFGDEETEGKGPGLEEVLSLFDDGQQQKLIPILKLIHEMIS